MKTLVDAEEQKDKLVLTYIKNYPDIVDGKVRWWGLVPIDLEKGTLGKVLEDGSVVECPLEIKYLNLTEELKEKMLTRLTWTEITSETGQEMLFPPNFETE
jgi:hypothetical protein